MADNIKTPKKLIEVALPLDDINAASAYEKLPGIGAHPRGIHHWWARRPFGAARAIIFSQMVNDPGGMRGYGAYKGQTKAQAELEREKLFEIVQQLADWKNTDNKELLERAKAEILKSWQETCALNKGKEGFDSEKPPAFHDPFAGGGALPLEAQRLGLEAYASDLNPVAVMINKAMIEIPPKFAGREPVGPIPDSDKQDKKRATSDAFEDWSGAKGLAEDVRRYGHWMREEAFKRIGHLYSQIEITEELAKDRDDLQGLVGEKLTVIAWLWARTVKSPNPAFSQVDAPLAKSFVLSSKKGKEAWVEPVIEGDGYRFEVRLGVPPTDAKNGTKLGRGANFNCLFSETPINPKYIYAEAQAGHLGLRLMAIVAEGKNGRVYLAPTDEMEQIANSATPDWKPETDLPDNPRWFSPPDYGMPKYGDLFTPRQLVALTIFSDLVQAARQKVIEDAKNAGIKDDGNGLDQGGMGATAYGDAVAVYLSFAIDRCTDFNNSLTGWRPGNEKNHGNV